MNTSKQRILLAIAIIIVSVLVIIGALIEANSGPFKIDGFKLIVEVVKETFWALYGFLYLFALMIWNTVTHSWISTLTTIGLIILAILYRLYWHVKAKDNANE